MSKALSADLRTRVLVAVAEGATHREAAERFGISAASVSRWRALQRERGDVLPGPLGGDRRSGRVEAAPGMILELLEQRRDATIAELRDALGERGHRFGYVTLRGSVWRLATRSPAARCSLLGRGAPVIVPLRYCAWRQ